MKSPIAKRSVAIAGRKTSVSMEEAFWSALKEIALAEGATLSELVESIDGVRSQANRSSAMRLHDLDYYRKRAAAASGVGA